MNAPVAAIETSPAPASGGRVAVEAQSPRGAGSAGPAADDGAALVLTEPRECPSESPAHAMTVRGTQHASYRISDLCAYLESYLPPEPIRDIYEAFLFGAEAHQGQQRQTGEPYIFHPLAVARILAEMRMDHKCLMAAILHDVIEDTGIGKDQLAARFGDEVAELVDAVSKLTQIDFKSRAEAQAANFQKMMLAMTRDIRVILIKLADRLHNMRTLGVMAPPKRRRISRETLEIYAPIANRLGINSIRLELEDLGFRHHWPWRHWVLDRAVRGVRSNQKEVVSKVETAIRRRLAQEHIDAEVFGRRKHLYSIYRKMQEKSRAFNDLVDVYAFRVVVDRVDTCYRVLGQMHSLYKPMPGRFKDYIAIPKSNGYQSLHTVLFGPQGVPIEVQIRTRDMHRIAESGIAAHWLYKAGADGGAPQGLASEWLQNLLEMQKDSGDSQEFLEHVKVDLFPDEVYVFTPKGRIMVLPKGATIVDFAYAIHSDVGNTCVAGRIDRRLSPLRSELHSGQTVEVINAPGAKPNAAWLNFVVTGKARANVRSYLKNLQQREAEVLGRRMLNAELAAFELDLDRLGEDRVAAYAAKAGLSSAHLLMVDIGLGNRPPVLVARRLADAARGGADPGDRDGAAGDAAETGVSSAPGRLALRGTEGMVVNFARCCRPIPGDGIVGIFSPGKGIVVHRVECRNLRELNGRGDKWIDVEWAEEADTELTTAIRVEVGNRRGALATIAAAIAEQGCNIENVQSREKDETSSTLDFLINVRGRAHLASVMRRLRQIPLVMRIARLSR